MTAGRWALAALLLAAPAAPAAADPRTIAVTAAAETAGTRGDADDPAIWVDPADPGRSLVLGTDKRGGLWVYGLDGAARRFFADGWLNNVDVRPFALGGRAVGLVGATRRNDDTLAFYVVEDGAVRRADPPRLPAQPAGLPEMGDAYGFALARDAGGATHAVASFRSGRVVQWRVEDRGGRIGLSFVRTWRLGGVVEGMVADDARGLLYVAEEDRGIWRFPLAGGEGALVAAIPSPCLPRPDVEGLAIHDGPGGRFLLASAQGVDRAAVFRMDGDGGLSCEALVEVAAGAVDGVSETDGLDATALPLPGYPDGLLVMMDDRNGWGTTNFKLVPWGPIGAALAR